jgi:hypothetical protein
MNILAVESVTDGVASDIGSKSPSKLIAYGPPLEKMGTPVAASSFNDVIMSQGKATYLFSGPVDGRSSVQGLLHIEHWRCKSMDSCLAGVDDADKWCLLNDSNWCILFDELKTEPDDFYIVTPPCGTFCAASLNPGGPRQLRSRSEPYGIKLPTPPFTIKEKESLRIGNVLNIKALIFLRGAHARGAGFIHECPELIFDKQVNVTFFKEYEQLAALSGVVVVQGDQCPHGAMSVKPTQWLVKLNCDAARAEELISLLRVRCGHPKFWQKWTDRQGATRYSYAAHLPIAGRKSGGAWATKGAENYPDALNVVLAKLIVVSGRISNIPPVILNRTVSTEHSRPMWVERIQHSWTGADIPTSHRKEENKAAVGGMRQHLEVYCGK